MIRKNVSLRPYNTFGLSAKAAFFKEINTVRGLQNLPNNLPLVILGGGSNLLLTKDIEACVLKMNIKGISVARETDKEIYVKVGAGVVWHEWVMFCVAQGWGGIENLSLIPGTVGASPIQNIGAYGVELKDVFGSLTAFDLTTKQQRIFTKNECEFGYRDSIFKRALKNEIVITSVTFKLQKQPILNTSYGDIQKVLAAKNIITPNIKDISDAVIDIRKSKLPDPAELGNSGSFFKNPEIESALFLDLQKKYPTLTGYPMANGTIKIAAGWLIEQAGWKGKRVGNTGCHDKQALVIVNYGNATGKEIYQHALNVIEDVSQKFGIALSPEVNIW
jgi:UDP-N-acetylmuramate dehydrogenase